MPGSLRILKRIRRPSPSTTGMLPSRRSRELAVEVQAGDRIREAVLRDVGHADEDDQPAAVGQPGGAGHVVRLADAPGSPVFTSDQADLRIQQAVVGPVVQDGQVLPSATARGTA